jgi:hypothetical protein
MRNTWLIAVLALSPLVSQASPAVDELLTEYRQAGAGEFSVEAGKTLYFKEFKDEKSGEIRQCSTCHTDNLTQAGKQANTGKAIEPLAPSVNSKRLTDIAEIRKWLKRNCKWTVGRECTPQEKGDVLTFIQTQ